MSIRILKSVAAAALTRDVLVPWRRAQPCLLVGQYDNRLAVVGVLALARFLLVARQYGSSFSGSGGVCFKRRLTAVTSPV